MLVQKGLPVTVVPDSAMGAVMDRADLCLVGAEGVMENGGIINKVSGIIYNTLDDGQMT